MRPRRSDPPLWFLLGLAVAVGLVCRWVFAVPLAPGSGGGQAPQIHGAFLGFLILLGEIIWKGLEVAGRITLEILHWLIINLSLIVTKIGNGLKALGAGVLLGLRKAWDFFEATYEHVLKPAWNKFWRWLDRVRKWLDDTFAPILRHLRDLRDALLKFWSIYVRPWLDLIDVTRRALRVLASLGLTWAKKLDAELARIEEAIERPFRILLDKVNEVINVVNRIVTLDGLLQRITLIASLARDYKYAWEAITNPYSKPIADSERTLPTVELVNVLPDVVPGIKAYLRTGSGPDAEIIRAEVTRFRAYAAQP